MLRFVYADCVRGNEEIMPFHHQWTDTMVARCAMAGRITYTFLTEFLFTSPFFITITWFPQVTRHEDQTDCCWAWTLYYTAEVDL